MTVVMEGDVKINVNIPQANGSLEVITLEEFNTVLYISVIADIAKKATISDTADLIFKMLAKSRSGDADLGKISKKLPCLKEEYLNKLKVFLNDKKFIGLIDSYNNTKDKMIKREVRRQAIKILTGFVEKEVKYDDLYFNFTKFLYSPNAKTFSGKAKIKFEKAAAYILGLNAKDPFVMATYKVWSDDIYRRQPEEKRRAYWFLIKDSKGNVCGMTFISSAQRHDKLVSQPIIGHSGIILDPSVQGRGYAKIIKSVMADFMYDKLDDKVADESLFATTCNEFNENSQGFQVKSGAKVLCDKDGNVVIDKGKMHWYATKKDIMNSEIMNMCKDMGIYYDVLSQTSPNAYRKRIGSASIIPLNKSMVAGYDR